MSSRYALYQIDALRDRFKLAAGVPKGIKPHYNISPTQTAPVIVSRDGVATLEPMIWGFIPHRAKNTHSVFRYKTFNTKEETIFDKTVSKDAIRTRRCLVPVNGYYEWHTSADGTQAYYIQLQDQSVFSLAGIYSTWQDASGIEHGTYSIVTTRANQDLEPLTDRMPIILRPTNESQWLDPEMYDANTLYDIMRPYPIGTLKITPVGQDISSKKIDKASLITPSPR